MRAIADNVLKLFGWLVLVAKVQRPAGGRADGWRVTAAAPRVLMRGAATRRGHVRLRVNAVQQK